MVVPVKFIVDENVGQLAKWLRMIGYDAILLQGTDDGELVKIAHKEGRVLLTRDTQILQRRVITNHEVKAVLIRSDRTKEQLEQVMKELGLQCYTRQFTRCMECNTLLEPKSKEEVKGIVPPYIFRTQEQYMLCPGCHRIYWRGTHWQRMKKRIDNLER